MTLSLRYATMPGVKFCREAKLLMLRLSLYLFCIIVSFLQRNVKGGFNVGLLKVVSHYLFSADYRYANMVQNRGKLLLWSFRMKISWREIHQEQYIFLT